MTIGGSILIATVGAILRYAVADNIDGSTYAWSG